MLTRAPKLTRACRCFIKMPTLGAYSRIAPLALVALLLVPPAALDGQMRGRRGGSSSAPAHPEAFKGVVVTFHGTLKKLTKKEIMIESSEDNHELVTFRRSKGTKFFEKDAEIKSGAIDLETV